MSLIGLSSSVNVWRGFVPQVQSLNKKKKLLSFTSSVKRVSSQTAEKENNVKRLRCGDRRQSTAEFKTTTVHTHTAAVYFPS